MHTPPRRAPLIPWRDESKLPDPMNRFLTRNSAVLRATGAFILLALLASCGSDGPVAVDLEPRTGEDLSPDQLAQAVAEHSTPADFVEPDADNLILQVRDNLLFVKGVVNTGSDSELIATLNSSRNVRTVVLTSVPGSANDEVNVSLGRKLRRAGITTYLPAKGMVASGGTDLLLSGVRRIVERGAEVGVHSWAAGSTNGNDLPRDHPDHQLFLDYYQDINIPAAFYWFTLEAAPPEGMHWMTEEEMTRYQVYTVLR